MPVKKGIGKLWNNRNVDCHGAVLKNELDLYELD